MKQTKANNQMNMSSNEIGKLPPQAIDIEDALIGALITERNLISRLDIASDDFYSVKNATIFKAIQSLYSKQSPVDMATVSDELRKLGELDNVGGAYHIATLSMSVNSGIHAEHYAEIIKEKAISRKIIAMCQIATQMAYDDTIEVSETIEFIEGGFTDISVNSGIAECESMEQSVYDTFKYIEKIHADKQMGITTAVPTGLKELDFELNGGFKSPELIILGGRPSMGKTQFAIHFAKHCAMNDKHCLFISLEMTKIQLVLRMITEEESINFYNIRSGQLNQYEWDAIQQKSSELQNLNIHIADDPKISNLTSIKSLARKMKRKNQLNMLIVDYLQLIRTDGKFQTRDLEIGHITRELKMLAKELDVPVVVLAQLSRPAKGVRVSFPTLSDLRESGNIEQDADVVLFPHRPCYYDRDAVDDNGESYHNRGIIFVGKNREGNLGIGIKFRHNENFKKIFENSVNEPLSRIQPNTNFYEPQSKEDDPF